MKKEYIFVVGFDKDVHDSELAMYSLTGQNVSIIDTSGDAVMPSCFAFDSEHKRLYVTDEMNDKQGKIIVYDLSNSRLKKIQSYYTHGSNPCYIELDQRNLHVCHYSYGGLQIIQLSESGLIENQISDSQIEKSLHSCLSMQNAIVLFQTLDNKILFNSRELNEPIKALNINSPRKGVLFKDSKYLYVLSEYRSTVTVVNIETMTIVQEVSTAQRISANNQPASIWLSSDGEHIIISNRGDNSIVSFWVDKKSGLLSNFNVLYTDGGKCPRDISISSDERILAVAFKESNYIELFRIERNYSHLTSLKKVFSFAPIGIQFLEM